MAFLFGGKKSDTKPQYTGIQLQTSSAVQTIPLAYGQCRGAPNLLWYGDFESHKHTQGGKGFGGGGTTTLTYSASVVMAISQGPITGIGKAWVDQGTEAAFTSLGFTVALGTIPQAPWPYLVSSHPSDADPYPGIAHLDKANYDLGAGATLPNHNFEVYGLLYMTGVGGSVPDADPALLVEDFLTEDDHGALYPSDMLDSTALLSGPDATTTGDAAYQTYCQAMGFALSPFITDQDAAGNTLERWSLITNAAMVWNGYTLKLVPYGDETVTANGVTYLPNTTPAFDLDDSVYIQKSDADPVQAARSDPWDANNVQLLNYKNRTSDYNEAAAPWQEDLSIDLYGRHEAPAVDAYEVCDANMAAQMVYLVSQRTLYIRNTFQLDLPPGIYDALEPMDLVRFSDPELGALVTVRLTEIEEQDDDNLHCTAEEYTGVTGSIGHALEPGPATPSPVNNLVDPGHVNTPLLIEPPSTLSSEAQLWVGLSGGQYWGGAWVWVSTDGSNYGTFPIGEVTGKARQGVTTTTLASYGGANPDTVHSVGVDLTESRSDVAPTSAADAAAGSNLAWLDGEYLTFQDATLTSTYHYTLGTQLNRGLFGSAPASHASAVQFTRLDEAIWTYPIPAAWVGKTVYLKFQSVNIWGNGTEDLSTCTAYPIAIAGTGYGGGSGGVPLAPTGLAANPLAAGVFLTWNPNAASDNVTGYDVYRAPGTGASFGSASFLAPVVGQAYNDSTAAAASYTYFLIAKNVIGSSSPSAGADAVASLSGALWGFGFERDLSAGAPSAAFVDFVSRVPWTMPAGLPLAAIRTNGSGPTAQTDFDLVANGVSVGTARFAIGATEATFIKAAPTSVLADQTTSVVFPANLNGMSGRMFGAVVGIR